VTLVDALRLHRRQLARTRELARQLDRVRALLEAGRAVNSARELDEVLQTILNRAVSLLDGSTGSVMLREGDELVVVASWANDEALHCRVKIGDAISGRVAIARRPQLVVGPASSSHFPGHEDRGRTVDSAMSVPMIDRGELVGVLNVGMLGRRMFDDDDVDLLSAFGEQAATAIAKTRLYEAARRATAELAYSATHDDLTGLPNRTLLAERIADVVRDGGARLLHGALLFIDIDGFKAVNDEFGHTVGDDVLCAVAARIRSVSPIGATPARVGGDEFALFLPEISGADEVATAASSIVASVRPPVRTEVEGVAITVSVGAALLGRHGRSYAELMSAADGALYDAKRAGKDCWRMSAARPTDPDDGIPRPRHHLTDLSGASRAGR
jgi:diguanylate cyclase (GGDEF)-like protein